MIRLLRSYSRNRTGYRFWVCIKQITRVNTAHCKLDIIPLRLTLVVLVERLKRHVLRYKGPFVKRCLEVRISEPYRGRALTSPTAKRIRFRLLPLYTHVHY